MIVENLDSWLAHEREDQIVKRQEEIGKLRFQQGIPLHDAVRGLMLVKDNMIEYLEERGSPHDSVALYAEEELEHRIGRFFDTLVIHLVRGYETAWHRSMELSAAL